MGGVSWRPAIFECVLSLRGDSSPVIASPDDSRDEAISTTDSEQAPQSLGIASLLLRLRLAVARNDIWNGLYIRTSSGANKEGKNGYTKN